MKYILITSLIFISLSCQRSMQELSSCLYDINIDYLSAPVLDSRDMPNDTLIIAFYGYFYGDTISVMINQQHFEELFITTDERSGNSGEIYTIKYKDVKNVGLRINNGKLIFIEPPKRQYNIQLMYLDSVATVKFHRRLPAND